MKISRLLLLTADSGPGAAIQVHQRALCEPDTDQTTSQIDAQIHDTSKHDDSRDMFKDVLHNTSHSSPCHILHRTYLHATLANSYAKGSLLIETLKVPEKWGRSVYSGYTGVLEVCYNQQAGAL